MSKKQRPAASLANLKPFKRGHDPRRNLKGPPKLPDLREALAKASGTRLLVGFRRCD